MKDLKYLLAYLAPLAAYLGIYHGGIWSPGSIYIGFVLIPALELFHSGSKVNYSNEEESSRLSNQVFDWLLYLNIPLLFGLLPYYFTTIAGGGLTTLEITGMTFSVGLLVGTIGINVAHELGHRNKKHEQWMSKLLLMTALYMHFFIEHNRGHHKNVATELDPASARYGESLYTFWIRSTVGSYLHAWKLERERLAKQQIPSFSWQNEMVWYQLIQIGYLIGVGLLFGWAMVPYAIAVAILGFLLLETVNYVEHYGLRREKLASGRYENVSPQHSWNSNHELGRIFLYELTRHSDHHFKANRKYQVLRHMDISPQLPYGYPFSMLMSLIPPIWFAVMNKEVKRFQVASLA
ncbi:MAG: alkane 1-monooxygenase [Bacteroidota bacterium]